MKPITFNQLMEEFIYPDKWGDWTFDRENRD